MGEKKRKSIRLQEYDYRFPGGYFITVNTNKRVKLFGEIVEGEMILNEYGEIVKKIWMAKPEHFEHVILDSFVVMPDHFHGILVLNEWEGGPFDDKITLDDEESIADGVGVRHALPLQSKDTFQKPQSGSLGVIVGSFKSAVTKEINRMRGTPGAKVWQRNYYEHIIRLEEGLARFRSYVVYNPMGIMDEIIPAL